MAPPKQIKSSITTKVTRGRQNIQIKKLENKSSRQVTFSKRRNGYSQKSYRALCFMWHEYRNYCVFPKGKPFCFGHPDINVILDRYLNDDGSMATTISVTPCFEEFNVACREASEKLDEEKRKTKEIEQENEMKKNKGEFWWDNCPIDNNMEIEELEAYVKAMEELRKNVASRASELMGNAFMATAATTVDNSGDLGSGFAAGDASSYGDFDLGIKGINFGHGPDFDY